MIRRSYTMGLRLTPTAPLTHGAGTEGNEQILRTIEHAVETPTGWRRVPVPAVSGAALRATLREHAVIDAMERSGIAPGSVSLDALRLLQKGGKNDGGGQTVPIDEVRRLRELFPLIAVFGAMDGGAPIRGLLSVSHVLPWCETTREAGTVPSTLTTIRVGDAGAERVEIPLWTRPIDADDPEPRPGRIPPIPDHLVRTGVTYYRHDLRTGAPAGVYLEGQAVRALEDQRAAVTRSSDAATRREANESMPHSMQAIAPGVPLYAELRLRDATDIEFTCLALAMQRWRLAGGHLGGAASKGHGACRVEVVGSIRHVGAARARETLPAECIDVDAIGAAMVAAYDDYCHERAEAVREYLARRA